MGNCKNGSFNHIGQEIFHEHMLADASQDAKAGKVTAWSTYDIQTSHAKCGDASSHGVRSCDAKWSVAHSFEMAPMWVLLAASMPKPKSAQL